MEMSEAEETRSVEACVRSSVAVAGVAAASSILGDSWSARWPSTHCLIVVHLDPSDNVELDGTVQSTADCQPAQSAAVCNNSDLDDDAHDAVKSPPSSHPRGCLGRMLGRLTVRDRGKQKSKQRCHSWSGCSRRVVIESSLSAVRSAGRRRRQATDSHDFVDNVELDDRPIQQFATSLTSTDVRDGRFTARLPVDTMPRGDVMIRMRSGRLEVLQADMNEYRRTPRRQLHGVIELPMYVDTDNVSIQHDALQECLVIEAATKGYQLGALRRRSMSLDELFVRRGRKIAHDLGIRLTPTRKRCQRTQTVVLCSETRAVVSTSDTSHD